MRMKWTQPEDLKAALVQAVDGEADWVQELLADGADPNGMPLIMAIQCDQPEIVQMLVDAGVDVNLEFNGTMPLIHAVGGTHLEIARILLAAGADVNQASSSGMTPLRAAIEYGRLNATPEERRAMVELIREAGGR